MIPSKYILVFDIQTKARCVKRLKLTFSFENICNLYSEDIFIHILFLFEY